MPNRYLQETNSFIVEENTISQTQDIIFEFMLNTARLLQPISFSWFQEVTGLNPQILEPYFKLALELEFITVSEKDWQITNKGIQFNNEFMQLFMD